MKRLYDLNGYLKIDLIHRALLRAKDKGDLPNISTQKIDLFVKEFDQKLKLAHLKVGDHITVDEARYVISKVKENKYDYLMDGEINIIEEIVLDKNFEIL